jgi:disulfide bond formation protein DsbB
MHYSVPIILFILAILSMAIAVMRLGKDTYPNIKNQADCEDPKKAKLPAKCQADPNCCAIWDNGLCRRAKLTDGVCLSKQDVIPMIMYIFSIVALIASIVTLVMVLRQK